MLWQMHPLVFPTIGLGLLCIGAARYTWDRSVVPGHRYVALTMAALVVWLLGLALELSLVPLGPKLFATKIQYLGVTTLPSLFFLFFLLYSGRERFESNATVLLLFAVPVLTNVIVWIRPSWIWRVLRADVVEGLTYIGVVERGFSSVHIPFVYGVYLLSLLLVFEIALRSPRLRPVQSVMLLLAVAAPLAINFVHIHLGVGASQLVDPTPLVGAIIALIVSWVIFAFRPFDLTPVAREAIVRGIADGLILVDLDDRIVEINPAALTLLGHQLEQPVGLRLRDIFPADWQEQLKALVPDSGVRAELKLEDDDRTCHFELSVTSVLDRRQRAAGKLVVLHDVTGRRRAQSALHASRQKLQAVTASAPMFLAAFDTRATLTLAVGAGIGMSGFDAERFVGRPAAQIFHEFPQIIGDIQRTLAGESFQEDTVISDFVFETTYTPEYDAEGKLIGGIVIAIDVTARRRMEMALQQSQRRESLGVLAGGIAHDFNNLLTAIMGQSSLAQAKLPAQSAAHLHIEKALLGAERAAELTRQLLAYAGKGRFSTEIIDLNRMIADNTELLQTAVSSKIDLRLELTDVALDLYGDRGQIQQVIMNLVINAAEAIGDQVGSVALSTAIEEYDGRCRTGFWGGERPKSGKNMLLRVADTGCGIDDVTLGKIFDPFFSTKESGSGLGLSATLGIIRSHNGVLQVKSQPGAGTTFTIWFPYHDAQSAEQALSRAASDREQPSRVVMLVEPDNGGQHQLKQILEEERLSVISISDSRAAVRYYARNVEQIALVILDLQLPAMDGFETLDQLHAIQPQVPVFLASPYSAEEMRSQIRSDGVAGFVQKPYDPNAIVETIRLALAYCAKQIPAVPNLKCTPNRSIV